MDVTPEQQRRINSHCLTFKREMQSMIDQPRSGIDSISMTFGGKTVIIAGKPKDGHTRTTRV